jgi:hypothetical protein
MTSCAHVWLQHGAGYFENFAKLYFRTREGDTESTKVWEPIGFAPPYPFRQWPCRRLQSLGRRYSDGDVRSRAHAL